MTYQGLLLMICTSPLILFGIASPPLFGYAANPSIYGSIQFDLCQIVVKPARNPFPVGLTVATTPTLLTIADRRESNPPPRTT